MKYFETLKRAILHLAHPNPLRDWFIVLTLSAVALIALIGVSVFFFLGIRSGSIVADPGMQIVRTPTPSRAALEHIVDVFTERRVNYESGNIRTPDVRDPS